MELVPLCRTALNHHQAPDSSPVISKLFLLINYLLGKRLGYARGEDGKASSFPSSPSLKSPF